MTLNDLAVKYQLLQRSLPEEKWLDSITCDESWTKVLPNLNKNLPFLVPDHEEEKYFQFGIDCINAFVQANFTGPALPDSITTLLKQDDYQDVRFSKWLSLNDDEININVIHPVLLVTAKAIFQYCMVEENINYWWAARALLIHQRLLDDIHPELSSQAAVLCKELEKASFTNRVKAELYIELAQLHLMFRNVSKVEKLIGTVTEMLGFEHTLMGKLGKRTKFQQKDLAQLMLEVKFNDTTEISDPSLGNIPKNLALNDEVRLDSIQLTENQEIPRLPNLEQKLLLAIVQGLRLSKPKYELQSEEVLPYLDHILKQDSSFSVRTQGLLLRSALEGGHKRTIERSIQQCEEVIACFNEKNPNASDRVVDVFGTSLPPIWNVKAQYAELLLNFGLVKASLDAYLEIKLWEEVIVCYNLLQRRNKAVEVIQQQLLIKPESIKLMCLLGDATDDESCYQKAWEMSAQTSYRAQRHWGQYLFNNKQYEQCIPHYQMTLSINPLQTNVLLRLGFAALETKQWKLSADAYQKYTALEPAGFEAWNNLAQAFIHLGNKPSAHQALSEALKCNFDNWKVWDNFMVISADTAHYSDVIRAYHMLLDLTKRNEPNLDVLGILIQDWTNKPEALVKKTAELMGRLTTVYPNCGKLWEMYADIAPSVVLRAQRLQRAYRAYHSEDGWNKDPKKCEHLLEVVGKLVEAVLDPEIQATDPMVGSVRMNLNAVLAVANRLYWNDVPDIVQELSKKKDAVMEKFQSKLQ